MSGGDRLLRRALCGLGLLVRDVERLRRVPVLDGLRIATLAGAGELEVRLRLPGGGRSTALTLPGRELELGRGSLAGRAAVVGQTDPLRERRTP